MVAEGYWLNAGAGWHRVTLDDYLQAMAGSGLFPSPRLDRKTGLAVTIPRDFKTNDGGLRGTTIDPSNSPPREQPRYATTGRIVVAFDQDSVDRLSQSFAAIAQIAQQFLVALVAAVEPLARALETMKEDPRWPPTPTGTTSPSGNDTTTPPATESTSSCAPDAGNPTGARSTS